MKICLNAKKNDNAWLYHAVNSLTHGKVMDMLIFEFIKVYRKPGKNDVYRIYSAIKRGFHLSRMTTNNLISSM